MTKKPLLIILIGPVCVGKTTLGKRLSGELGISIISKDTIKELFFDTVGWVDIPHSRRIGKMAYVTLYYSAINLLKAKNSVILDANFIPELASKKISYLKNRFNCLPIQINCFAQAGVLEKRFFARNKAGTRHPGHCEDCIYEEIKESLIRGWVDLLDIEGSVINLDMTDFDKINYQELINKIKSY
ncbi:MAG: AAA family ATPase [Patescibacteria group bacterium]